MKKKLNRFQHWIASIFHEMEPLPPAIETIPLAERMSSEAQLLSMFHLGHAQGEKTGYQRGLEESVQRSTMRQHGYEQSAWNAEPERITEPNMAHFQQHPGRYALYHKDMERKKFQTIKLGPITEMLPTTPLL